MFDFHNHFTGINAFKYTSELLPEKIVFPYNIELVKSSEIGLDKRFSNRVLMEKQVEELKKMLLYSKENNIGVSLHCVQSTSNLLKILKEEELKPLKAVFHNFTGSKETARELEKLGVIISISPRFKGNLKEIFNFNQYLVLETDYTGNNMEEYKHILTEHYINCSKQLGMSLIELEARCNELKLAFTN